MTHFVHVIEALLGMAAMLGGAALLSWPLTIGIEKIGVGFTRLHGYVQRRNAEMDELYGRPKSLKDLWRK